MAHADLLPFERERLRFIRKKKGDAWEARPIRMGRRFNLGHYPNAHDARRAVQAFLAAPDPWSFPGLRPRYVIAIHGDGGTEYEVRLPNKTPVRFECQARAAARVRKALRLNTAGLYSTPVKPRAKPAGRPRKPSAPRVVRPEAECQEIAVRYWAGESSAALAKAFGCSRVNVWKLAQRRQPAPAAATAAAWPAGAGHRPG